MGKDQVRDPYDLQRFVSAQAGVFEQACTELRQGRKRSHWMWFIFPQLKGLGGSPMAVTYAISLLAEARAYLDHALLGQRLRECSRIVVEAEERSVNEIFGYPDDLKFHSSMTLFAEASEKNEIFHDAIEKYFGGELDRATRERL